MNLVRSGCIGQRNGIVISMLVVSSIPAGVAFYEKLSFAVENRNDQWWWAMLRFGRSLL